MQAFLALLLLLAFLGHEQVIVRVAGDRGLDQAAGQVMVAGGGGGGQSAQERPFSYRRSIERCLSSSMNPGAQFAASSAIYNSAHHPSFWDVCERGAVAYQHAGPHAIVGVPQGEREVLSCESHAAWMCTACAGMVQIAAMRAASR